MIPFNLNGFHTIEHEDKTPKGCSLCRKLLAGYKGIRLLTMVNN